MGGSILPIIFLPFPFGSGIKDQLAGKCGAGKSRKTAVNSGSDALKARGIGQSASVAWDNQEDTEDAGSGSGSRRSPAERTEMKTKKTIEKGRIGQSFDDFLKDEGRYDHATNQGVKRVTAFQLAAAMENRNLTKSAFARQLKTSRSQLDRLLDPDNTKVTLDALTRAAHAVGRELQLKLR